MINDKKYLIDYRTGSLDCPNIEQRIGKMLSSYMFKFGSGFGLDGFYESDIQWIENNITKNSQNRNRDILWRFDDYINHQEYYSPYISDYSATFLEQFMDTPGIPQNVNRLLWFAVGRMRAWYDIKMGSAPYQHFLVERWMDKTRGG